VQVLLRTVQSFLWTARPECGLTIVDDGSDDPTHVNELMNLARDHPDRVHLYFRPANGGVARAKNSCIRLFLQSGELTRMEIM